MRTDRTARIGLELLIVAGLVLAGLASVPQAARSAEACGSNGAAFELLDPGDEDSGIGGTGRGETTALDRPPRAARGEGDDDSGIGGTGRAPGPRDAGNGDGESGIGGTGIFGTVTRTDRLCVNGLEIEVPPQLAVEAATADSPERALAQGQVVLVRVVSNEDGLTATAIRLYPELAGRIELLAGDHGWMRVAGRRVLIPADAILDDRFGARFPIAGDWVVVHGLPDGRGRIVASRIEPGRAQQMRHPESQLSDWQTALRRFEYLSIEGYVTLDRGQLRLAGADLPLVRMRSPAADSQLRPGARVRADGRLGWDGVLRVERPPGWTRPVRPSGNEVAPDRKGHGRPARDGDAAGTGATESGARPDAGARPKAGAKSPRPTSPPDTRPDSRSGRRPPRRPDIRPPERPAPRPERPSPVRPTLERPTTRPRVDSR